MLVKPGNFSQIVETLTMPGIYALDTETTGLEWHKDAKLFSIIIATEKEVYYFDFNEELALALDKEQSKEKGSPVHVVMQPENNGTLTKYYFKD